VILIESGDILEFDELGARKAGRSMWDESASIPVRATDVVEASDYQRTAVTERRRHCAPIIAIHKLTGRVGTCLKS